MKTISALLLAALAFAPLKAQVFRPETVNGAFLGGLAGAVIGNNSGSLNHNAWKGAAIGSVAGALIGSSFGSSHNDWRYDGRGAVYGGNYSYAYDSDRRYGDYNRRAHYGYDYGYTVRAYEPNYRYLYRRPYYATTGLWLGGISGGIIGNNGHYHDTWRGAGIGAATGLFLGSIADDLSRERIVEVTAPLGGESSTPPPPAASAPQNVTIINNYYNSSQSSMTAANGMFGR